MRRTSGRRSRKGRPVKVLADGLEGVAELIQAVRWDHGDLILLDQRALPDRVEYVLCLDFRDIAKAIKDMVVRGAPAIGIAGGYGIASAAGEAIRTFRTTRGSVKAPCDESSADAALVLCRRMLDEASATLAAARPTAVNLKWAVDRVMKAATAGLQGGIDSTCRGCGAAPSDMSDGSYETTLAVLDRVFTLAEAEARAIEAEDIAMNIAMGEHGAALIKPGSRVLTHCNAGALATGGYGTALGVIRTAWRDGKVSMVYADETRPWLQGARLTAWELSQDNIPVTLLVDSAAGYLMSTGGVDCVIVGADRIARNGDVANKIGTYTLACLAKAHGIPFYVAAPTSTFDLSIADKSGIPVEMRDENEVLSFRGSAVAPKGVAALNPAFDLTPAHLISAIITERGVISPPIGENLPKVVLGDEPGA